MTTVVDTCNARMRVASARGVTDAWGERVKVTSNHVERRKNASVFTEEKCRARGDLVGGALVHE